MKIHVQRESEATILALEGDFISEVDQVALRQRVNALVKGNNIHLVVDLGGVKHLNSCGLGSLVCILTTVRKVGGDLRLARVGPDVARVMEITNLGLVFQSYPSVASALAELGVHA